MAIYKNVGLRMTQAGLRRVCDLLVCTVPQFRAVLEVEARGAGFDKQGRVLILFEPHVFWRCLPGPPSPGRGVPPPESPERLAAQRAGLAYPKWRTGAYPKDSYPRLAQAMAIDETAALKACSWGMGQVLGENHRMAGFGTVQDMVEAFARSEDDQILGMARFIQKAGLAKHLRDGNWAAFARGYNGPAYAEHNYHGRLAAAHTKWIRAKDQWAVPAAKSGKTAVDQSNAAKAQAQATAAGAGGAAAAGGVSATTTQPSKPEAAPQAMGRDWTPVIGWAAAAVIIAVCAVLLWRHARRLDPADRWTHTTPLAAGGQT